ncbi:hypothetical protein RAA17_18940 [Komagataeibacter rhaeticus]|nr:hypothetical protein [Komagataeibacter rhaeticus]
MSQFSGRYGRFGRTARVARGATRSLRRLEAAEANITSRIEMTRAIAYLLVISYELGPTQPSLMPPSPIVQATCHERGLTRGGPGNGARHDPFPFPPMPPCAAMSSPLVAIPSSCRPMRRWLMNQMVWSS